MKQPKEMGEFEKILSVIKKDVNLFWGDNTTKIKQTILNDLKLLDSFSQNFIPKSEVEDIGSILEEITKGEGAFNREPLIHADNTIVNMKELANKAIIKLNSLLNK